ncbi:MAG: cytochrome c family protein [Alphaproteobacteria bacterium]
MRGAFVGLATALALLGVPTPWAADRASGRTLFKRHCAVCHVIRDDGRSSFGPNLAGVMGRTSGTVEGYPYSDALRASGLVWSEATLEPWIADPSALVPGTAMKFRGLADRDERTALLAYLLKASQ